MSKKAIFICVLQLIILQFFCNNNTLFGQVKIEAQTGYYTGSSYSYNDEWIKINGSVLSYWTCCDLSDGLKFVVFDSSSCVPWLSLPVGSPFFDQYGAYHCQSYTTSAFDFFISNNDSTQNVIAAFINAIPQSNSVIMISHKNHFCEEWNDSLVKAFRAIGSSIDFPSANRIPDGCPYILFGRKGANPGSMSECTGSINGSLISLGDSLYCTVNSINEADSNFSISIYPSPTFDFIKISAPPKSKISIINFQGQIIETLNNAGSIEIIDIETYLKGMYFVKVEVGNKIITKKFLKK